MFSWIKLILWSYISLLIILPVLFISWAKWVDFPPGAAHKSNINEFSFGLVIWPTKILLWSWIVNNPFLNSWVSVILKGFLTIRQSLAYLASIISNPIFSSRFCNFSLVIFIVFTLIFNSGFSLLLLHRFSVNSSPNSFIHLLTMYSW